MNDEQPMAIDHPPGESEPDLALAHHRRDARTAALVHTLLIVALIVLWFLDVRWGVLRSVSRQLLE